MRKILNVKYLAASLAMLGALLFQSCAEDETFDVVGTTVNKVYFNTQAWHPINVPKNSYLFSVTHTPIGSLGSNISIKLPVHCTHEAPSDFKVNVEIDNSLVNELIERTGINYIPVPNGFATVSTPKLTIVKGTLISFDSISVSIPNDKFAQLTEQNYVLPLRISSMENASNTVISSNLNTIFVLIKTTVTNMYNFSVLGDMVGTLITPKTGWVGTVNYTLASGTPANMLNTTTNTFWSVTPGNDIFDWSVNMASVRDGITGVRINTNNAIYNFTMLRVYSSIDGLTWHDQGITEPTIGAANQYIKFYAPINAQYLKFEVLGRRHATQVRVATFDVYRS